MNTIEMTRLQIWAALLSMNMNASPKTETNNIIIEATGTCNINNNILPTLMMDHQI